MVAGPRWAVWVAGAKSAVGSIMNAPSTMPAANVTTPSTTSAPADAMTLSTPLLLATVGVPAIVDSGGSWLPQARAPTRIGVPGVVAAYSSGPPVVLAPK